MSAPIPTYGGWNPPPGMTEEHQGARVQPAPTSHTVTQVKAQLQGELKTKDEQLQKQAAKSRAVGWGGDVPSGNLLHSY